MRKTKKQIDYTYDLELTEEEIDFLIEALKNHVYSNYIKVLNSKSQHKALTEMTYVLFKMKAGENARINLTKSDEQDEKESL